MSNGQPIFRFDYDGIIYHTEDYSVLAGFIQEEVPQDDYFDLVVLDEFSPESKEIGTGQYYHSEKPGVLVELIEEYDAAQGVGQALNDWYSKQLATAQEG